MRIKIIRRHQLFVLFLLCIGPSASASYFVHHNLHHFPTLPRRNNASSLSSSVSLGLSAAYGVAPYAAASASAASAFAASASAASASAAAASIAFASFALPPADMRLSTSGAIMRQLLFRFALCMFDAHKMCCDCEGRSAIDCFFFCRGSRCSTAVFLAS
jgi:hypothetical protein